MSATPLKGLPADMIADLMGKSRTRNAYGPKVITFSESDEAAINPAEAWPIEFGNKSAGTMYQGFRTAIKAAGLEDTILVKRSEDSIFLLHTDRVKLAMEELLEAQADAANAASEEVAA